jgi:hypothetical protein
MKLLCLPDILTNIKGDDFFVANATYLPSYNSIFLRKSFLSISDTGNSYYTLDCFSFNRKEHAMFVNMLLNYANFVYENEDYFEFINKQKLSNDFVINTFLKSYNLCNSNSLYKTKMFITDSDTLVFVDGVNCFVQNEYFNRYHMFDDKYEIVVKNKISMMQGGS